MAARKNAEKKPPFIAIDVAPDLPNGKKKRAHVRADRIEGVLEVPEEVTARRGHTTIVALLGGVIIRTNEDADTLKRRIDRVFESES